MNTDDGTHRTEQRKFRIILDGKLDERRQEWFEDVEIVLTGDKTELTGTTRDRTELHGLLKRIHDLNLDLNSVEVEEPAN
ncbi:MAG: hypothetical protein K9N46_13100 [Candidatus Marinimicrobia bacterium]|nr:hypothetical protein [Candidatus Neomarinimicrobiota bacterium]MCF7829720.1 hypothetical protein [Candidatus Neomarinimicrobiota bacterium]MCF7881670.1 hypothetical protein [Candidatus Neomarinimicrobiota bacterium]